MNEHELRDRLHHLAGSVAAPEDPMPTLVRRRRKKRKSAGVVLAAVAVVALASGRQSLENLLSEETGVELSVASAPLGSEQMLPPKLGELDLTDQLRESDPGKLVSRRFIVLGTDLVRIAVRCQTPNSSAHVVAKAPGYLDQPLFTSCSSRGEVLDVPLRKLWKLPSDRSTSVVVEIALTSTYGGGPVFVPAAEVAVGRYRTPGG